MKTLMAILLTYCISYTCSVITTNRIVTPVSKKSLPDPYQMIDEGQALLQEGDLVVRLNQDPASRFIKNFNRHDKSYSHAGIVLFENGYPYVFHIVNGEENPGERLRKDSLKQFCDPGKNTVYGIFRYEMRSGEINKLKSIIYKWYAQGILFDSVFNLNTDDRMYCSEMVSKALMQATDDRIVIETTPLKTAEALAFSAYSHLPFSYTSRLKVISIDDLYMNSFCHLIKKYNYEKNN